MRTLSNLRQILAKVASAAAVSSLLLTGGCLKSLLDSSELARNQGDRLVVPILKSIDPIDETDTEFTSAEDVKPGDLKSFNTDYVISRNDVIQVSVMDLLGSGGVENVRTARVSETGMLTLPLLNNPVMAAGLTEQELQKAIAEKYREAGLLQNAQVTVTVTEARGRTFSILGAVARPGQYSILDSDFRVLNALVQCGDVTNVNSDVLYIVRKKKSEQPTTRPQQSTQPANEGNTGGTSTDQLKPPGMDPLMPKTDPLLPAPGPQDKKDDSKAPGAAAQGVHPALAMMQADAGAAAPRPGTANASDERYIIIDGKPVLIGPNNQPVNPPATNPSDAEVAAAPVTQPAYDFGAEASADMDQRIIRVPLHQLRNGDLRYNVVIRPSDTIIVPPPTTGLYYMGGHVGSPGVYGLNGTKVTLRQAVIGARMLDPYAVPWKTDIVRRIGDNELVLRVDLSRVFEGKEPDVYIKPNDMITVGTDWYPPFLIAIRSAFRLTYGFGFLYDRNWAPQQKYQGP